MNLNKLWNNYSDIIILVITKDKKFVDDFKKSLKFEALVVDTVDMNYQNIRKALKKCSVAIIDMNTAQELTFFVGYTNRTVFLYTNDFKDKFTRFIANIKLLPVFDKIEELSDAIMKFLRRDL